MEVAEVLVFDYLLGTNNRTALVEYLIHKYIGNRVTAPGSANGMWATDCPCNNGGQCINQTSSCNCGSSGYEGATCDEGQLDLGKAHAPRLT